MLYCGGKSTQEAGKSMLSVSRFSWYVALLRIIVRTKESKVIFTLFMLSVAIDLKKDVDHSD